MSTDLETQSALGSLNPMLIRGDISPSRKIECTVENYKYFIQRAPEETGERWIYRYTYTPKERTTDSTNVPEADDGTSITILVAII